MTKGNNNGNLPSQNVQPLPPWLNSQIKKVSNLSLDDFDCNEFMIFIKNEIKSGNPTKTFCERMGELMLYAWKIAPDEEDFDESTLTKAQVEADVIQDVFFFSVCFPKKYAQKFAWITDAFVPKLSKKQFNHMFFRCLLPILWRNLESVNEDIRLSASRLLLKFYPLRSNDAVVDAEYLQKQVVAMDMMLMDDCVLIRVEAIKKVLLHLRLHWSTFPRYIIKAYLEKIVDKLSLDKADEVRVAVYEGMSHLMYCPQAKVATQHALQILCHRGIHDRSVSVRLAAFKLLNILIGHRHFNCFNFVNMEEILKRLDFEHSEAVQRQIVRLIFPSFCPTENHSLEDRFKRIYNMCKVSRNAALNFHRHIYSLKLVSLKIHDSHILPLIYNVKARLARGNERRQSEQSDLDTSLSVANGTLNSTLSSVASGPAEQREERKIRLLKDVLDSAIVLWTTMRCDLHEKDPAENEKIQTTMANILKKLIFFMNTSLIDSAVVIASNLPIKLVDRNLREEILNAVSRGNIETTQLSGYLEAFSSWEPDRLVELIKEGLEALYKAVACDSNGVPIRIGAPRPVTHSVGAQARDDGTCSDRESPPMKRLCKGQKRRAGNAAKANEEPLRSLDYSLKVLNSVLSSPVAFANFKGRDGFHIVQFCVTLRDIRRAFAIRLRMNNFKSQEEISLMVRCYETLTLLSIISQSMAERYDDDSPNDSSDDEVDPGSTLIESSSEDPDANSNRDGTFTILAEDTPNNTQNTIADKRLISELKWMRSVMRDVQPHVLVVKMFLRCVNLHLDCNQLTLRTLRQTTDMIIDLFHISDMDMVGDEMRLCAKRLTCALEYCDDENHHLIESLIMRLKIVLSFALDENDDADDGFED